MDELEKNEKIERAIRFHKRMSAVCLGAYVFFLLVSPEKALGLAGLLSVVLLVTSPLHNVTEWHPGSRGTINEEGQWVRSISGRALKNTPRLYRLSTVLLVGVIVHSLGITLLILLEEARTSAYMFAMLIRAALFLPVFFHVGLWNVAASAKASRKAM